MINSISILGSTGSVGRQAVEVARRLGINVRALTTNNNIELLEQQARLLKPAFVAVGNKAAAKKLRISLADTGIAVGAGIRGLTEAATIRGANAVVTAVSGSIGLRPTLAAIDKGRRIALANKETLVCAGSIVKERARKKGAEIIPVDSEHSAIFQCLEGCGSSREELRRIILTASGGPFRGLTREETASVTPQQALRHPNWSMGAKISIDSATLMNKGLEFIEAMHLFDCSPDNIQVLIHPESIIHSMVEFIDGSIIAQMAMPDMSLPIQYALTYPARRESFVSRVDFAALGKLSFEEPDMEKTPCLALAMEAAKTGGTAPAILSAANEEAVAMFLEGGIGFNQIFDSVAAALGSIDIIKDPTLDEILESDAEARKFVRQSL
ncbi:MAG TPA: 1-deoxy-D-xylulose-5-phosphate reductoisomerase [Clostridiales bacterium]|nr:1-deoxy-D-xylulose-5-phosphate reductoisomerase [Clostridiales bacterium]